MLGASDFPRHVIVGVLWALWHLPLIFSTHFTSIPHYVFLPLFTLGVIILAIIFGQLRKLSGSVWPVVLAHGMANALGYAIVEGKLIAFNNELMGNIVPGSITLTAIYGLIAFLIMHWKRKNNVH